MGRKKLPEIINPPLNVNHTQRLDTLRSIRIEQSRLYRAAIRGRLPSDELGRLVYALKEIRSTLEAEIASMPDKPLQVGNVNLRIVPAGAFANTEEDGTLLEYQPPLVEPLSEVTEQPTVEILPPPEPDLIEAGDDDDDGGVLIVRSTQLKARRHQR
jgi:hypothetical protein